jgi:hypothetical protein
VPPASTVDPSPYLGLPVYVLILIVLGIIFYAYAKYISNKFHTHVFLHRTMVWAVLLNLFIPLMLALSIGFASAKSDPGSILYF